MKHLLLLSVVVAAAFVSKAQVGIGTNTPSDQLHTTGTVRFEKYKGNGLRPLQVDDSGRLVVALPGTVFSNATNMAIPDNGCATTTGISSNIFVTGMPTGINPANIAVTVSIDHAYDGDLLLSLTAPNGYVLFLAVKNGTSGDNFNNTIFSDAAASYINAGTAPFEGSYKPIGTLFASQICQTGIVYVSDFAGLANGAATIVPNGTWSLKVFDAAAGDVGTLKSWSISFNGMSPLVVNNGRNRLSKFNGNGGIDASNILQNPATGRIGISSNPSFLPNAALDVDGRINSTGASFDGNVGVGGDLLTSGNLASDGGLAVSNNATIGGTIKIGGGSPGVGKVLTSNATGDATWQSVTNPLATTGFLAGYKSGAATSFTSGTDQLVPFADNPVIPNMTPFDDGNNFDNTNSEYTAPSAGFYQFTTKVRFQPPAGPATQNGLITMTLYKNGNFYCLWFVSVYSGQPIPLSTNGTTNLKLAAGDKIKIKLSQSSGQTLDIWNAADTQFSGYKIY